MAASDGPFYATASAASAALGYRHHQGHTDHYSAIDLEHHHHGGVANPSYRSLNFDIFRHHQPNSMMSVSGQPIDVDQHQRCHSAVENLERICGSNFRFDDKALPSLQAAYSLSVQHQRQPHRNIPPSFDDARKFQDRGRHLTDYDSGGQMNLIAGGFSREAKLMADADECSDDEYETEDRKLYDPDSPPSMPDDRQFDGGLLFSASGRGGGVNRMDYSDGKAMMPHSDFGFGSALRSRMSPNRTGYGLDQVSLPIKSRDMGAMHLQSLYHFSDQNSKQPTSSLVDNWTTMTSVAGQCGIDAGFPPEHQHQPIPDSRFYGGGASRIAPDAKDITYGAVRGVAEHEAKTLPLSQTDTAKSHRPLSLATSASSTRRQSTNKSPPPHSDLSAVVASSAVSPSASVCFDVITAKTSATANDSGASVAEVRRGRNDTSTASATSPLSAPIMFYPWMRKIHNRNSASSSGKVSIAG